MSRSIFLGLLLPLLITFTASAIDPELRLIEVAQYDKIHELQELLKAGVSVNAKTRDGVTPLMAATLGGHSDVVQILLGAGADVNARSKNAVSVFTGMAHPSVVGYLLNAHTDSMLRREDRITPLMLAAIGGHSEIVSMLLDAGADVNARDARGWTALIWSAKKGYSGAARILSDAEIDIAVKEKGDAANLIGEDHVKVVLTLLEGGADVNMRIEQGYTALMVSASAGYSDIVRMLLENKADIDVEQVDGRTVLMLAATQGHVDIVQVLLSAGASVNAKEKNGRTALMLAESRGNTEAAELLKKAVSQE